MRFDPTLTREQVLEAFRAQAQATWGAERLAALDWALANAANAVWQVAQQPLGPTDEEPDFLGVRHPAPPGPAEREEEDRGAEEPDLDEVVP
jgi:hypothetical protein